MSAASRCTPTALGLALCLIAPGLSAQTLDGKAPANGKVMSFNELRACLMQQEELVSRRTSLEAQREQLEKDRIAVEQETESVKAAREVIEKRQDATRAYNERTKAFGVKVADLKRRYQELADSGSTGRALERSQASLEKERQALAAEELELKSEADRLSAGMDSMVTSLNARVEAQGSMAAAWNARSRELQAANTAYDDDRQSWRSQCGNRRYREEDEKLIRADMKK